MKKQSWGVAQLGESTPSCKQGQEFDSPSFKPGKQAEPFLKLYRRRNERKDSPKEKKSSDVLKGNAEREPFLRAKRNKGQGKT